VKIVRHEKTPGGGVVIYREAEKPGELHAHFIMPGLVEERRLAWDLPDEVDPVDVLLAEVAADPENPMPSAAEDGYESNRARVLAEAKSHANKVVWPNAKAKENLKKDCDVDEDHKAAIRHFVSKSMAERGIQRVTPAASMKRAQKMELEFAAGAERRNEELLAEEIIQANPELKLEPRRGDGKPVGLTVKFV
jgi:hypothetical protein